MVGAASEHMGSVFVRPGRAYLLSGATGQVIRAIDSPNPQQSGRFGIAVSAAGDADGDGTNDVLVGAGGEQSAGPNSGRAYLFSGATGTLLLTLESPNAEQTGFFGSAVAGIDDLDADGRPELLIGGQGENTVGGFGAGRVYAFGGADGGLLFTLESPNAQPGGVFGSAVAAAGDTDGDGRPDILLGAMGEDMPAGGSAGRAYVVSAPIATASPPAPNGASLRVEASPNPTRGDVSISFVLPLDGAIRLSVFDALGREVARPANGERRAGRHDVSLRALPPGAYLLRLAAGADVSVGRLTVIR